MIDTKSVAERIVREGLRKARGMSSYQSKSSASNQHGDLYNVPDKKPYWDMSEKEFEKVTKEEIPYPTGAK